ncbi:hypothetical protein DFP72DRAFT_862314 [Ephemerocybe angulata]|uniref:Uncharacterized protein n=1 Tax=Ephemerocybe angulata TaxID=980116 RepID=A0A8H6LSV3_9AGAR|nr:hypothetical protein DFP72DRAFT_862314 [Tulosesus angulatus]
MLYPEAILIIGLCLASLAMAGQFRVAKWPMHVDNGLEYTPRQKSSLGISPPDLADKYKAEVYQERVKVPEFRAIIHWPNPGDNKKFLLLAHFPNGESFGHSYMVGHWLKATISRTLDGKQLVTQIELNESIYLSALLQAILIHTSDKSSTIWELTWAFDTKMHSNSAWAWKPEHYHATTLANFDLKVTILSSTFNQHSVTFVTSPQIQTTYRE